MNGLQRFVKKNASTILTCVGAAGVIGTSVLTAKGTIKATKLLEEAKEEKGEELTTKETVQVAAPAYIPAALAGTATIVCIFGANILNKRAQAALTSAYALLDQAHKDYKKKTTELYGEDAHEEIKAEMAKDNYKKEEIEGDDSDGKRLFYDDYSQRYFRATNETILRAEYELNRMISEDCGALLNDYFDLIGLKRTDYGDMLGWESGQLYEMYCSSWVHFSHQKVILDDGLECTIISVTDPLPDESYY